MGKMRHMITKLSEQRDARSSFRTDIQGLRAIAVVVVVLDHLFRQPQGGFVGVDVFYVISGFLITGVILREYQKTGWVSFSRFYIRRVRRILPVAATVLVVVVIAALTIWYRARAEQTLLDVLSAFTFSANWHFVRVGADYLQSDGPVSAVQHYWSLSVEEQFYAIWPVIVLLVLVVASKYSRWALPSLIGVTVLISAASLAWSIHDSAADPAGAYFNTFGRAWELLAGALLAMFATSLARIGRRLSLGLTWTGVLLIGASLLVVSPTSAFPGPWALLPVMGAVGVIAGGTSASRPLNHLLDNGVAQYLGKISYSLYLWHFPVIVFGQSILPRDTWWTTIVLVGAMLALSQLSFRFIEEPFRHSKRTEVPQLHNSRGPWRRNDFFLAVGVGIVIVALSVAQLRGPSMLVNAADLRPRSNAAQPATQDPTTLWADPAALSHALDAAVQAGAWPALAPSLNVLSSADQAPQMHMKTGCRNSVGATAPNICSTSDGPREKTALVLGDSVAMSWMPAVEESLDLDEWRVVGLGFASCPAVLAPVGSPACTSDQERMFAYAEELKPDLIFLSSAQSSIEKLSSGATGSAAVAEWKAASTAALLRMKAIGSEVVLISNPPAGADPRECANRLSGPQRCLTSTTDAWFDKSEAEQSAAQISGATYIDASSWVCNSEDLCPLYVGSTPIRFDQGHLTGQFSRQLGPVLAAHLQEW